MNIYFILAFIFTTFYRDSSMHTYIMLAKYLDMITNIVTPDNKLSAKRLRGNILQVKYHDGEKDCYALLPYAVPTRKWIRVLAVINDKERGEDLLIDVTETIIRIAGPGKDFFKVNITPSNINPRWKKLFFQYPRKRKKMIFQHNDVIKGL